MDYNKALSKYNLNTLVSRKKLYSLIYLRLEKKIELHHISAVIGFLFEEIIEELFQNGKFVIDNFGALVLKRLAPRNFFNFQSRKMQRSKGNNIVRFQLFNSLRQIILNNLDIAKTFKDDQDV